MDKGWFLPSFSVAEADSGNVFFFFFLFLFILGCVSRLCWLKAQGHHSRAMFSSP